MVIYPLGAAALGRDKHESMSLQNLQRAVAIDPRGGQTASGSWSLFPLLPRLLFLFPTYCLIFAVRFLCLSLKVLQRQRHYPKFSDQMKDWPVTSRRGTITSFWVTGPQRTRKENRLP